MTIDARRSIAVLVAAVVIGTVLAVTAALAPTTTGGGRGVLGPLDIRDLPPTPSGYGLTDVHCVGDSECGPLPVKSFIAPIEVPNSSFEAPTISINP